MKNFTDNNRVFERTLSFILLIACKRLFPCAELRFENSLNSGVYITARGIDLTAAEISSLAAGMQSIINDNLPFTFKKLTKKAAALIFANRPDKLALINRQNEEYVDVYECGGVTDSFYGELLKSTGDVGDFSLIREDGGMVLVPGKAAYKRLPKLLEVFRESNRWIDVLDVENFAQLNTLTLSGGIRKFVRVNEALMDKRIMDIAQMIYERRPRIILIAGPSSSGKTTFCNRMSVALRVLGLKPVQLSLDNYYLDRDKIPLGSDGKPDLECVEALDTELLGSQLNEIIAGREVQMPEFDFTVQKRSPITHSLRVAGDAPLLIEGIHGLNERLTPGIERSLKFKIYISALTSINIDEHNRIHSSDARLLRRIVRDAAFRGTPAEGTLNMWQSVRAGEEKNIFPFQEEADVMINSCLAYELAAMKHLACGALSSIKPDAACFKTAQRLLKLLNLVEAADVLDEIPLNSLLREFVGGSCFYRG